MNRTSRVSNSTPACSSAIAVTRAHVKGAIHRVVIACFIPVLPGAPLRIQQNIHTTKN
jgi:hypothetical protein